MLKCLSSLQERAFRDYDPNFEFSDSARAGPPTQNKPVMHFLPFLLTSIQAFPTKGSPLVKSSPCVTIKLPLDTIV